MGRLFLKYSDDEEIYVCKECGTHLTSAKQIISKDFTAHTGKAYLFDQVINLSSGAPYQEHLRTGLHIIRKVHCNVCIQVVGWTYDHAYEEDQKYKIGKTVIERFYIQKKIYSVELAKGQSINSTQISNMNMAGGNSSGGVAAGSGSFNLGNSSFSINSNNA